MDLLGPSPVPLPGYGGIVKAPRRTEGPSGSILEETRLLPRHQGAGQPDHQGTP